MNHNAGHQTSNSEHISILYTTVHMARHILDAESVNFETAREGEEPKQRDIDTTPVVVGFASLTSTPHVLPSVRP